MRKKKNKKHKQQKRRFLKRFLPSTIKIIITKYKRKESKILRFTLHIKKYGNSNTTTIIIVIMHKDFLFLNMKTNKTMTNVRAKKIDERKAKWKKKLKTKKKSQTKHVFYRLCASYRLVGVCTHFSICNREQFFQYFGSKRFLFAFCIILGLCHVCI